MSNIKEYIKRPVTVSAIQYTSNDPAHIEEIVKFCGSSKVFLMHGYKKGLVLCTLEGEQTVELNSFIIRGIKDECYSCKSDIFKLTYALSGVDEEALSYKEGEEGSSLSAS